MTAVTQEPAVPAYEAPPRSSRLILETAAWVIVLGHIVHWAVDAGYYLTTQVSYMTRAKHGQAVTVIGSNPPGDWWDRATVHAANILGLQGTILDNNGEAAPLWWVTWRHDIRYVVIGVVTGVIIFFLTSRPRKARKSYGPARMALTLPLALACALPGVIAGGVAIWKVRWLQTSGITAPPGWGILGHEISQWSASGKPALLLLGLLGSWAFARFASIGPADEAQWIYAQRRACRIQRDRTGALAGAANFADSVVIGPPGYRSRVRYLVRHGISTGSASPAMTVVVGLFLFLTIVLAGYGAWLTLAGPAAGA